MKGGKNEKTRQLRFSLYAANRRVAIERLVFHITVTRKLGAVIIIDPIRGIGGRSAPRKEEKWLIEALLKYLTLLHDHIPDAFPAVTPPPPVEKISLAISRSWSLFKRALERRVEKAFDVL